MDALLAIPPGTPLDLIPLAINPDGSPPDFLHGPTLWPTAATVTMTFAVITSIVVVIRIYENALRRKTSGVDDVFCVLALILTHAYVGIVLSIKQQRHAWDTSLASIDADFAKKIFMVGIIWGPTAWCAKCAILFLLHRLFALGRGTRIGIFVGLAATSLVHLFSVPFMAIVCIPRAGENWGVELLLGRCSSAPIQTLVQSVTGTAMDIYIILLPIPTILGLQIDPARKIRLCLIFSLGAIALIAGALGLYYRVLILKGEDTTWNTIRASIAVLVEIYIGIGVSCGPAIVSVWRRKSASARLHSRFRSVLSSRRTKSLPSVAETDRSYFSKVSSDNESGRAHRDYIELQGR